MKTILFSVLAMTLLSGAGIERLVGRWESISSTGNVTGVVFKDDNTFEGYVNQKPFVTGTYDLVDSTFTMSDNGCMGVQGTYKLSFFSKNDSFRIHTVSDDCEARANGVNGRVFGRIKK
jgi:hypothetical protein